MKGLIIVPRNGASVIHIYDDPEEFARELSTWISRIHLGQWQGEISAFDGQLVPIRPEVRIGTWIQIDGVEVEGSTSTVSSAVAEATIAVVSHVAEEEESVAETPAVETSAEETPAEGSTEDDGGPVDTAE